MLKIENFELNLKDENLLTIDSLLIETGRKVNLVGINNSGKSLLMSTIHGDFCSFSGEIHIKEKPPIFYKKRKKTILLENESHLLPEETVWKNIILPLPKVTPRQKSKIMELCSVARLENKLLHKVKSLSFSQKKYIELIRGVIQLPYLILLDDIDSYFDEVGITKALEICEFALNGGSSLIATSKRKLQDFDTYYRIQNKRVVQL